MPRKDTLRGAARNGGQRFNEAGAVMPRKARPWGGSSQPPYCFNEAGAVMPRKAQVAAAHPAQAIAASMRPGQ